MYGQNEPVHKVAQCNGLQQKQSLSMPSIEAMHDLQKSGKGHVLQP